MTLENLLSQMGIGTKQLSERYSEYGAPIHDQHVYYAYEPPPSAHGHSTSTKYGGVKTNASMSALTLLAFLFFLHILQQCIKEHMADISASPIMVMTAGRESEDVLPKDATSKIDKTGVTQNNAADRYVTKEKRKSVIEKYDAKNPFQGQLTKINLAEQSPKIDNQKYENVYRKYANQSSGFAGYVSAMDEDE